MTRASRNAVLPVAAGAELLDESEMGGLPAELDACSGRLGALVKEKHLREVVPETRARLLVGAGDGARCTR